MYTSHVGSVCRQWGLQQTCLVIKPRGGLGDRFSGKQLDELCAQEEEDGPPPINDQNTYMT